MGWTRRARPEAPGEAAGARRARRAIWVGLAAGFVVVGTITATLTRSDRSDGSQQVASAALERTTTTERPSIATAPSATASTTSAPTTVSTTTTPPASPDPTTAVPPTPTTAPRPSPEPCTPAPLPAPPRWGPDPSRYDPATVQQTPDPTGPGCGRARVLILGDSIGRGAANALKRANPGNLELWDRTEHGCGMVAPRPGCAGWRAVWTPAVALIDPDVVVVVLGASGDLVPGEDPPFHSAEAAELRRAEVGQALDVLGSRGARVVWVLPAVPLPEATFFCGGRIPDTPCDRTWVDRWHADVGAVAGARGVATVDLRSWMTSRPVPPLVDRPDGLHLTGPALDAQAAWLLERIRPGRR